MRPRTWILAAALAAALPAAFPARAAAWGKEGHELVGRIADKYLSSRARAAVNELLQNHQYQSLSDGRLANWADAIRMSGAFRAKYPGMAKWHYIDLDVNAAGPPNLGAACPNDDCVRGAIAKFQAVLKDPTKPAQDRREALFFLVHFVGDLHQPLHCAERDNDRGGNLQKVHSEGDDRHLTNLHKVWDTDLVLEAVGPLGLADYAGRLVHTLPAATRRAYQKGSVDDWILETHKIAREKAYMDKGAALPPATSPPHTLSGQYMLDNAEVVEEQLTKGGVRLAKLLNDLFAD